MSGTYVRTAEMNKRHSEFMKGKKYGLGHKMTEEHKKELSLRMLGNQYTKGLKHTEETKLKISKANKGKPGNGRGVFVRTVEMRQAQSERMLGNKNCLGKKHSEERKERSSKAMYAAFEAKYQREIERENTIYRLPNGDLRPDFFEIWNKQNGIEPKEEPKPSPVPVVPIPVKKKALLIELNRKREPSAYALGPKPLHPWSYEAQAAKRKK